jgi:Ser/Thr protein kinase RdoA (MazF antagonist)
VRSVGYLRWEPTEQPQGLYTDLALLDTLAPDIIQNKEGSLLTRLTIEGIVWQVILMEYMSGEHQDSYVPQLLQSMATTQAHMHMVSSDFSDHYQGFVIRELRETYFIKQIDMGTLRDSRLIDFLERAKQYHLSLDKRLPWGLCHLDYDKDNILADRLGNITAMLDFDDLALAPYVLDLAYTLLHVYWHAGIKGITKYLAVYEKKRRLSTLERHNLQQLMLFRYYVLCSHNVLNGETEEATVAKYLALEEDLLERNLFIR